MGRDHAINMAVDECIEKNILKGILIKNRAEVVDMLLTEYNLEKVIGLMKDELEEMKIQLEQEQLEKQEFKSQLEQKQLEKQEFKSQLEQEQLEKQEFKSQLEQEQLENQKLLRKLEELECKLGKKDNE